MMSTTESEVGRWVGTTARIAATLRSMQRAADAYSRIQERWCSEEMDDATGNRLEAREARLEQRIQDLAQDLPLPWDDERGEGRWGVAFEGDPRGHTVALVPLWDGEDAREVRRTTSRYVGVDR